MNIDMVSWVNPTLRFKAILKKLHELNLQLQVIHQIHKLRLDCKDGGKSMQKMQRLYRTLQIQLNKCISCRNEKVTLEEGENIEPRIPEDEDGCESLEPKSSEVREEYEPTCLLPSIIVPTLNLYVKSLNLYMGFDLNIDNPTKIHPPPPNRENPNNFLFWFSGETETE